MQKLHVQPTLAPLCRDTDAVSIYHRSSNKLVSFYRLLEYENMLHCVPSNVSSGLNDLPLSHIYFNSTKTDQKTSPFLPTGERLNGRKVYEKLVAFYTTTNIMTSAEIYNLGWKQINSIYSKVGISGINYFTFPCFYTRAV